MGTADAITTTSGDVGPRGNLRRVRVGTFRHVVFARDVRGGAFSSGAGRGGAKERVNRLIQKFDKSAYIVMEIFVVYYDVLINENIISSHF